MAWNRNTLIRTRKSLLSRLKNPEDQESWQEFFDSYGKLIYGAAIRAGLNDAEAQEVVQDTVIGVAKKIQEFRYDPAVGSFKGWLLRTTQWRIHDQFRKRLRLAARAGEDHPQTRRTSTTARIPDPRCDFDAIWDQEWRENLLERALERVRQSVNAKQYQIFDLYVMKQWPAQKVAQSLGINRGRVFLAKHRISARLKEEIEKLEQRMV